MTSLGGEKPFCDVFGAEWSEWECDYKAVAIGRRGRKSVLWTVSARQSPRQLPESCSHVPNMRFFMISSAQQDAKSKMSVR